MSAKSLPSKALIMSWDDWEALYFDGKLVAQGHSLRVDGVLDVLKVPIQWEDGIYEVDEDGDPIEALVPKELA